MRPTQSGMSTKQAQIILVFCDDENKCFVLKTTSKSHPSPYSYQPIVAT